MTKNTGLLYFSFVIKGLIVLDNACNSICSGRQTCIAVWFSTSFSNLRPDTEGLYQAARARTIADKNLEVKRYIANIGPVLPSRSNVPFEGVRAKIPVLSRQ